MAFAGDPSWKFPVKFDKYKEKIENCYTASDCLKLLSLRQKLTV